MLVYRLTRAKYADKLSGVGASLANNRWNTKGVEIIYTAGSRALAMAEVLVHLPVGMIPTDYVMMEIDLQDLDTVAQLTPQGKSWNKFPNLNETQQLGNAFIKEQNYLVAKAPSAVVQGDFNYLINPHHKDFSKVKIRNVSSFLFDDRLF